METQKCKRVRLQFRCRVRSCGDTRIVDAPGWTPSCSSGHGFMGEIHGVIFADLIAEAEEGGDAKT